LDILDSFFYSEQVIWVTARIFGTLFVTSMFIRIFKSLWAVFVKETTIHQKFIKNVAFAIVWVIGVIMALGQLPNFADAAVALAAGSGLVAITIGLAAQESLSNAFNGVIISLFRPFEVGDRVHLVNANITGFIEDITIRHTVIRTFTNSRIIIPNSVMNQELLENSNFCNPQASAFIDVIITFDSDMEKATEIVAGVIGEHNDFVDMRTPEDLESGALKVPVFVRNIGLFGVELRASMWTATVTNNFAACSDVRRNILIEFEKAGIKLSTSSIATGL